MAEPVAPAAVVGAVLEAETDDWDKDSGLGDECNSSTSSIASSIMKYREENGRTYHAYKDGNYAFPNDERENDRLDLQHHLFKLTLDGKLFTAPIPQEREVRHVLDVGTGTGIWAIDYADAHPETQVIGVDLSPIQPHFVPPNLVFEIDDLEETWTFRYKFDFIFSRMMVAGLANFPRFFEQSFENLTPGGWIEMTDICFPVHADDDSLPADCALKQWTELILEGTAKAGRPADSPLYYKSQLEAAGFTNIKEVIYKWPQNRWPKEKKFKELGLWVLEDLAPGLEGLSVALFTRILGWTKEDLDIFLAKVRKDMRNTKIHSYYNIHVVTAQKPT